MERDRLPKGYWTRELCIEAAAPFRSIKEWVQQNRVSYDAARKNGWMPECTACMGNGQKPKDYWTHDRCKVNSLKFNTRSEWQEKSVSAYNAARRNGWEDCFAHMPDARKKVFFMDLLDDYWLGVVRSGIWQGIRIVGVADQPIEPPPWMAPPA
jgi:hypothetical protein